MLSVFFFLAIRKRSWFLLILARCIFNFQSFHSVLGIKDGIKPFYTRQVWNLLPLNPVGSVPIPGDPLQPSLQFWSFSYSREINKTSTHALLLRALELVEIHEDRRNDGRGWATFNHWIVKIISSSNGPFKLFQAVSRLGDSFSDFNSISMQHSMIIDNYYRRYLGEVESLRPICFVSRFLSIYFTSTSLPSELRS